MSVGEAFITTGQIYVMGFAIALGLAALIKLICYVINKVEAKAAKNTAAVDQGGNAAQ